MSRERWVVGDVEVVPVSDGTFFARAAFFGATASFAGHAELLDGKGVMPLPVGSFLLSGPRLTLVDAGIGDVHDKYFDGGRLPAELAAAGHRPEDVDRVVCTHLHPDHTGWLVREDDLTPMFPNAEIVVSRADWDLFVTIGRPGLAPHIREGLSRLAESGRVRLVDGDDSVARGVDLLAAPGHTPGHVVVVVSGGEDRLLLLGDAITCPVQLHEPEWGAISDVDAALAARTRESLWRELEREGTSGSGAHFPGLQAGQVLAGTGRRWST